MRDRRIVFDAGSAAAVAAAVGMSALSDRLRRRILHLCPDWAADELSPFIYLEGGYSNDNYRFQYRGERYVLRVPSGHRPFVDRNLEQRLYAAGASVGMPDLVAFDTASGEMITRWVPGPMLADCQPRSSDLADYLDRLHRQMPPIERIYDPVLQAQTNLEQVGAPEWVEKLAARLVWTPEQLTACHNDLNPWNVICTSDGRWITLDWEWAGRNDPLFDLVTLHQGASLADSELAPMAERLLGAAPPAARLTRCLVAFWLRETTWAIAEIEAGRDRAEVREQQRLGLERLSGLTGRV